MALDNSSIKEICRHLEFDFIVSEETKREVLSALESMEVSQPEKSMHSYVLGLTRLWIDNPDQMKTEERDFIMAIETVLKCGYSQEIGYLIGYEEAQLVRFNALGNRLARLRNNSYEKNLKEAISETRDHLTVIKNKRYGLKGVDPAADHSGKPKKGARSNASAKFIVDMDKEEELQEKLEEQKKDLSYMKAQKKKFSDWCSSLTPGEAQLLFNWIDSDPWSREDMMSYQVSQLLTRLERELI